MKQILSRNKQSLKILFSSLESRNKEFEYADAIKDFLEQYGYKENEDFTISRTSDIADGYEYIAEKYGEIHLIFGKEDSSFYIRPSSAYKDVFLAASPMERYVFDFTLDEAGVEKLRRHFNPVMLEIHSLERYFEGSGLIEGVDFTIGKAKGLLFLTPSQYDSMGKIEVSIYNTEMNFKRVSDYVYNVRPLWNFNKSLTLDCRKDKPDVLKELKDPSANENFENANAFSEGYDSYSKGVKKCPYKYGTEEFNDWWDGRQEAEMDFEE